MQNNLLLDVKGLQRAYLFSFAVRVPARTQRFPVEVQVILRQKLMKFRPDSLQVIVNVLRRVSIDDFAKRFANAALVSLARNAFVIIRKEEV